MTIVLVILGILALISIGGLFIGLAFNVVSLIIYLAVSAVIGFIADWIVPGNVPYGLLGAILAGIVGGWVGHLIFGLIGLGNLPIIPAIVGAVVVTLIYSYLSRRTVSDRTTV